MKTGSEYFKRQVMYESMMTNGDGMSYGRLRDELRLHLRAVRKVRDELKEEKGFYPGGIPFLDGKEAGLMDALEVVAKIRTGRL